MPNDTTTQQAPQEKVITFGDVPDALVFSSLSEVTIIFKGFDFAEAKFRYNYINNETQEKVSEIIPSNVENITEPNPDFDTALPPSDTNPENITYPAVKHTFSKAWIDTFYPLAYNGNTATLNIEIFHLNAQLLQVVDNEIFTTFKDAPITTPVAGLIPLSYQQPFADIGIRGAVPQKTPEGSDELSWEMGYTEPYQRPTNRDGKYIKMGQYNQILYDITKSALTIQDNMSILAKFIDDEFANKLQDVQDKIQEVLTIPPDDAVLLKGNQTAAGLKNFTGVNAGNFKNSPNVVANLRFCNGMPFNNFKNYLKFIMDTNVVVNIELGQAIIVCSSSNTNYLLNNKEIIKMGIAGAGYQSSISIPVKNNDVIFARQNTEGGNPGLSYLGY